MKDVENRGVKMKAYWINCNIDGRGRWHLAVEREGDNGTEVYFPDVDFAEEMSIEEYGREFPSNRIEGPVVRREVLSPTLYWWHAGEDDTELVLKCEPDHCRAPVLRVHRCLQDDHASVYVCCRGDNDEEITIGDVLVPWRVDLPECSCCSGIGKCHDGKTDTTYDCPWCKGTGLSVMDEGKEISSALYWSWLRSEEAKR